MPAEYVNVTTVHFQVVINCTVATYEEMINCTVAISGSDILYSCTIDISANRFIQIKTHIYTLPKTFC